MRQVVVEASVNNLLRCLVNEHYRMLRVRVWISVNYGYGPWAALFIQDHIPVDPCRRGCFDIIEDHVSPIVSIFEVIPWLGGNFSIGTTNLSHPKMKFGILLMQASDLGEVRKVVAVIWQNRNIFSGGWIAKDDWVVSCSIFPFGSLARHYLRADARFF